MNPNPPIPGHILLYEGHTRYGYSSETSERIHTGGCECGAKPPGFPSLSVGAMKRFHRAHKAELRGETAPTIPAELVTRILELLGQTEHRIKFTNGGWTIEHPLRERIDGSLFACEMHWDDGDIGFRGVYVLHDDGTIGDKIP